jgi:anti-sigma factor RsiW
MDSKQADLLLEPERAPAKVQAHLAECDRCRQELAELRATLALLDRWEVPEPSPYFMTRFDARLREARGTEPAGWFARLRARFAYGPAMHVRPLAAMALSVLLLLGGGAYLGVTDLDQVPQPTKQAAVVHDLQTLDSNAQLLDQMEALSTTNDNGE